MSFALNSFHFVPHYFLINYISSYSLNSNEVFALFAALISLPSEIMECIFYFNSTISLTGIRLNLSFIFPITFFLVESRHFDCYSLKSNKCLFLKKSS